MQERRGGEAGHHPHQKAGGALAIAEVEQRLGDQDRELLGALLVGLALQLLLGDGDEVGEPAELGGERPGARERFEVAAVGLPGLPIERESAVSLGDQRLAGDAELEEPAAPLGRIERLAHVFELFDQRPPVAAVAQAAPHFGAQFQGSDYITRSSPPARARPSESEAAGTAVCLLQSFQEAWRCA